jgi:hypothetical protein
MAEFESEVRAYRVGYKCDRCKEGELLCTGDIEEMGEWEIIYQHECNSCHFRAKMDTVYPKILYRNQPLTSSTLN